MLASDHPDQAPPFRLGERGVERRIDRTDKETGEVTTEWRWVCSYLEVLADTRSAEGSEWGRYLEVKDRDGKAKNWAMPMSMLAGDGLAYREILLSLGLILAPGPQARHHLHEYISTARPGLKLRCVGRVGWHGDAFVMPDITISPSKGRGEGTILQTIGAPDHAFRVSGTLAEWQQAVARPAAGNSRLVLSLSAAFAAPLLYLVDGESGGFQLRGGSSIGKTTALVAAGSVCGGGGIKGYVRSWRMTDNGAESVALAHCDLLLCLDELAEVSAQAASAAAYMLANGRGKVRANKGGEARPAAEWRCMFLSTGEITLADKIAEEGRGRRTTAGQEVRVIDLPADAGAGLGLFENLHGAASADAFARQLKEAAGQFYGTALRAFLDRLVKERDSVAVAARHYAREFVAEQCPPDADGQVKRVATRFGLVAAAGAVATAYGILPWGSDEAAWAAATCFRAWLDNRGGTASGEECEALAAVRRFIEQHGSSRFEAIRPNQFGEATAADRTVNRAGFREEELDRGTSFFVLPEVWKREVCAGLDATAVARAIARSGHLKVPEGSKSLQIKRRIPGYSSPVRCYHIASTILG